MTMAIVFQSKTILYLNSVTQGSSGCVGRHKTDKLLDRKTLPVIIGWLKRNDEAAVVSFPKTGVF